MKRGFGVIAVGLAWVVACGQTEADDSAKTGGAGGVTGGTHSGGKDGGGGTPTGGNDGGGGTTGGASGSGGFGGFAGSGGWTGGAAGSGGWLGGAAGIGAAGGAAGSGGSGGLAGSGGWSAGTCYPLTPPVPGCGASECGNGVKDSCSFCPDGGAGTGPGWGGMGGGIWCQSGAEDCDSNDLGSATCVSLGYSGGTLGCSPSCFLDTANCDRCMPTGGHLVGCKQNIVPAKYPSALAIAASDQEIALAWVSEDSGQPATWFARLNADLSLISKTGPFAPNCADALAIAPRPGGWMLAAGWYTGVMVYALDANGVETSSWLATKTGMLPAFANRPADSPLLVWSEGAALGGGIISADGKSMTGPVNVPLGQYTVDELNAAFVGNGFLATVRAGSDTAVVRIESNGTTNKIVNKPVPKDTEHPALSFSGSDVRLVYNDFASTPSVKLVHLDTQGKAITSPVLIGGSPDYFNPAFPVAIGTDTLVVFGNYTGGAYQAAYLDAIRFNGANQKVWGPQKLAADPSWLSAYRIASRGNEVVVAWIAGTSWAPLKAAYPYGIGAARIQP